MIDRVKALLFPPKCAACGVLLDWYDTPDRVNALCTSCKKQWKSEKLETCGACAKPITVCSCMPEALRKSKCLGFRKLAYYLHGRRDPVQNRIVFHLKEKRDHRATRFLAAELLGALEDAVKASGVAREEILLTWIPRTAAAKSKYGTDQAEELVKALSRRSGIACRRLIGRKWGSFRQQKGLSVEARIKNARSAFRVVRMRKSCPHAVFLVDDVITTGASAAACVRLLRDVGVEKVYCFAITTNDANR